MINTDLGFSSEMVDKSILTWLLPLTSFVSEFSDVGSRLAPDRRNVGKIQTRRRKGANSYRILYSDILDMTSKDVFRYGCPSLQGGEY